MFTEASVYFSTDRGMILGDLNADCSYVSMSAYSTLNLIIDNSFTWWIGRDIDTTTGSSDCAYDRYIVVPVLTAIFKVSLWTMDYTPFALNFEWVRFCGRTAYHGTCVNYLTYFIVDTALLGGCGFTILIIILFITIVQNNNILCVDSVCCEWNSTRCIVWWTIQPWWRWGTFNETQTFIHYRIIDASCQWSLSSACVSARWEWHSTWPHSGSGITAVSNSVAVLTCFCNELKFAFYHFFIVLKLC